MIDQRIKNTRNENSDKQSLPKKLPTNSIKQKQNVKLIINFNTVNTQQL